MSFYARLFILASLCTLALPDRAFAPPLSFYLRSDLFRTDSVERIDQLLGMARGDLDSSALDAARESFAEAIPLTEKLIELAESPHSFERLALLDIAARLHHHASSVAPVEDLSLRFDGSTDHERARRANRQQLRTIKRLAETLYIKATQNMDRMPELEEALLRTFRGGGTTRLNLGTAEIRELLQNKRALINDQPGASLPEIFLRLQVTLSTEAREQEAERQANLAKIRSRNIIRAPPGTADFEMNVQRQSLERFLSFIAHFEEPLWDSFGRVATDQSPEVRARYSELRRQTKESFRHTTSPFTASAQSAFEALEWSTYSFLERSQLRCLWALRAAAGWFR